MDVMSSHTPIQWGGERIRGQSDLLFIKSFSTHGLQTHTDFFQLNISIVHLELLGSILNCRLIAAIVSFTDDEKCLIDHTYGVFEILLNLAKKGVLLNQTKLNPLQATKYRFPLWWRNTCSTKYTGNGFSLLAPLYHLVSITFWACPLKT
jgi:hypothetical protein